MMSYNWKACEDFQIPENSVKYGSDDDGSVIYCGKAWLNGKELPAQIIPDKRQSRIFYGKRERIVPHCSKVLIASKRTQTENCRPKHHHAERHHHNHHHGHHHHREDDCCRPSGGYEEETTTTTKSESNNKNESKTFIRTIRVTSSNTTTTVKKETIKKKPECWTEKRTRMVPKVSYQPKVRYERKVHMERTVKYVPETYEIVVCADDCCKPSCCKPCQRNDSCGSENSSETGSSCVSTDVCEADAVVIKPKKCSLPRI